MRRAFQLPQGDRDYLDARGLPWETVVDGGSQWLLLHDYPIVSGYDCPVATAAVLIAPLYPEAQIDMVYFYPKLARIDGRPIPALADQVLDGKTFQRWSRHRPSDSPWRLGVDDVGTHFVWVDDWLRREFRLR